MFEKKYLINNFPSLRNDGPAFLAPISIEDKRCFTESGYTIYEIDVLLTSDLDYLTIITDFETESGVIVDSVSITKNNLIKDNTYRYQFKVDFDEDIHMCVFQDNLLYSPDLPMTSTCTGDSCIAVNENTSGDLPGLSFQSSGLLLLLIVAIILIGYIIYRFDTRGGQDNNEKD